MAGYFLDKHQHNGPNRWRCGLALLLFAALSGCASLAPLKTPLPETPGTPQEIAERFEYRSAPVDASLLLRDERDRYRVFDGSFDAGVDDDATPITFEYYEQESDVPVPVILVLPILNGQKHIARPFAAHFARNGYAVVIVDTLQRRTLLDDLLKPEAAIRRTAIRHRRVLDWVETQPGIDIDRIAVFGASLGGFNALFLTAADPRVRASAMALVAGDLPYVLSHSTERHIVEAVDEAIAELQIDRDGLHEFLEREILSDPMELARYIDPASVLMVLATFDNAVPYEKQLELRAAMRMPAAITLQSGHITAAFYIFYLRKRVREFFDRKFDRAPDGAPDRFTTEIQEPSPRR